MTEDLTHSDFFPYSSYRSEQQEIIHEISLDARLKRNMLLVAPSGTGKTITALSSLLPLAYEKDLKIIYMCRTHTQSARIIKELKRIDRNLPSSNVVGLSLRGRKEMCVNPALMSNKFTPLNAMIICSNFREKKTCSYYNRLMDKINPEAIISKFNKPLDAQEIFEYCKDNDYCPYYFTKILLSKARILVCNFQWMINTEIRNQLLTLLGKPLNECILVIDECHNLIDMATMAKSNKLSLSFINSCLREIKANKLKEYMTNYVKFIEFLKQDLRQKKKSSSRSGSYEVNPNKFLKKIYKVMEFRNSVDFEHFFHDFGIMRSNRFLILFRFWQDWMKNANSNKYFFCYNLKQKKNHRAISLEIVALEPREATLPLFLQSYACLNLSGTVNPYIYRNLSGVNRKHTGYKEFIANSPFSRRNIKALIIEGVTTRMNRRVAPMYLKIIQKIEEVIRSTPANIGIFCASYEILNSLCMNGIKMIVEKHGKKLFIEKVGMSASENAIMLNKFKILAKPQSGAVLLGVCGGRNSEGEDYPGDFMNAVIIVGIPYHVITPRVNAKIEYYNKVFHNQGWLFAYVYPAMQRANEASGRPIRKEGDKGVIVYLDSRFKVKRKWIADWIRKEVEVIADREYLISQKLLEFWK